MIMMRGKTIYLDIGNDDNDDDGDSDENYDCWRIRIIKYVNDAWYI